MTRGMFRRIPGGMALLALAAAGCSPGSSGPLDSQSPEIGLDVQAQHAANLRAIEEARKAAPAQYEEAMRAWEAMQSGNRPMTTAGSGTYVPCQPLPFEGQAKVIGDDGGTFYFGPHKLQVPEDALSSNTSIAVMVNPDVKTRVTLLPHGLQFAKTVKLTLAYAHCTPSATHKVVYVDAAGNVVEWLTSTDKIADQKVESSLQHFSDYAIAY